MEVEYESSSALPGPSSSSMPPPPIPLDASDSEAEDEEDAEEEEEEEDEEEEEVEDENTDNAGGSKSVVGAGANKKRPPKPRQSLAEKPMGTTIFPISRVKKIVKADKELDMMTGEAVFMISVATEYFIKHFMEEGYTKARLDKRKIVNYRDMAAVVARSQEFDFLKDVIPAPMAMSEALELRKRKVAMDENPTVHEEAPITAAEVSENMPALIPSTNPLFPNAVVKKPPNTHAKTAAPKPHSKSPTTPKVVSGKNAPSTPHSLTTRGSARRSLVASEVNGDIEMATEGQPGEDVAVGDSEGQDSRHEAMDED